MTLALGNCKRMGVGCTIAYIEGLDEFQEYQDIQHYGRLGMKWYQHKFGEADGRSRYMQKGLKKLDKYQKKTAKLETKRAKNASLHQRYKDKGDVLRDKYEMTGKTKYLKKASKLRKKAFKYGRRQMSANTKITRLNKKGEKIAKRMTDMFGTVKASELNPEQVRLGKKYCLDIMENRK